MTLPLLVFLFCGAAMVYFAAIYPALLAVFPWRRKPEVQKDPAFRPAVSILLAVHNGAAFLPRKLDSILALDYPRALLQILVVSDGSDDATDEIAASYSDRGVRLIAIPRGGKASALNAGMAAATGEIVFFTDVRQTLAPDSLSHLVANFADPTVGCATGELHYLLEQARPEEADMGVYWRYEIWVRKRMSEIDSMFFATGCLYAMRRELLRQMPAGTLGDDAYLPIGAFLSGYRMIFDPAAKAWDIPARLGSEFSRRLRTLAGLWQNCIRFPALLGPRNRMWIHFMSHKFGRLALPWLVLGALVSGLALADPLRWAVAAAAGVFALAALADLVIPAGGAIKRITSPPRTLLVMLAASMCSVVVFFVPADRLWRGPSDPGGE